MIVISKQCIDLIKGFEAFRAAAYHGEKDPPGVFTIGYGTIKYPPYYRKGANVQLSDPAITEIMASDFLRFEVTYKARYIDPYLRDDLQPNQFAALLSLAYNIGEFAFKNSTVLRLVNADKLNTGIRAAFEMFCHDEAHNVVEGLLIRRKKEADLYFTPPV